MIIYYLEVYDGDKFIVVVVIDVVDVNEYMGVFFVFYMFFDFDYSFVFLGIWMIFM